MSKNITIEKLGGRHIMSQEPKYPKARSREEIINDLRALELEYNKKVIEEYKKKFTSKIYTIDVLELVESLALDSQ